MGVSVDNIGTRVQSLTEKNAPDFEEISAIFRKRGDWFSNEELDKAREDHPLKLSGFSAGKSYVKLADYIFQCQLCAESHMPDQWYRVILGTIGGNPYFHRETLEEDVRAGCTDSNLLKILPEDKTAYQHSAIHHPKKNMKSNLPFIEDIEYVCDHCWDTVVKSGF